MPLSLRQTFLVRREQAQRQGLPVPPLWTHRISQRYEAAWLDYWAAVRARAEREGWYADQSKPRETNDGKPAPQDHRVP